MANKTFRAPLPHQKRERMERVQKISQKIWTSLDYDGTSYTSRGRQEGTIATHGTRLDSIVDLALTGHFDSSKGLSSNFHLNPNQEFRKWHKRASHLHEGMMALREDQPDYDHMMRSIDYAETRANSAETHQDLELTGEPIGVVIAFNPSVVDERARLYRDDIAEWELALPEAPSFKGVRMIFPVDRFAAAALTVALEELR